MTVYSAPSHVVYLGGVGWLAYGVYVLVVAWLTQRPLVEILEEG